MTLGYFDDEALTVETWQNLWFHTGDQAVVDDDGYLYFRGRSGDRIRHRGVNVSSAQIEAIAVGHPAVGEAAVIGVPAGVSEDDIKLAVMLKDGMQVTPEELHRHLSLELPKSLVPRYVEIRQDFPRTETQKIQKNVLRNEGDQGLTSRTWDADCRRFIDGEATSDAEGHKSQR